ncbi:helix-turn-helix transcriptional regulator [Clostridium sp. BJN0001]|uniref:helix-turn-helix domain-containing protein n=1 Tax=Clostridium sp. BJN0001 TaxID=2930219 RepID=UPI001FD1D15E|nr:helix-turn-helix transcriptional regulator [Clostridium sp. BJN0001]
MDILTLGEKIKQRRKQLNMTLKDLAKKRITPGQISLIECGKSNPSVDLLEYLAKELKTSVQYLVESEQSQAEKICIFYLRMSKICALDKEYDKAYTYIDKSFQYAEKYSIDYIKAELYNVKAELALESGKYDVAEKYYLSANAIFIRNKKYKNIIYTFLNLSDIAVKTKAFNLALNYLKQSEKVYDDNVIMDKLLEIRIKDEIARVYFYLEDLRLSSKYAYIANEKLKELYDYKGHIKRLFNLAEEFSEKGDLQKASNLAEKALLITKKIDDEKSLYKIESTLGRLFYMVSDIDESIKHLEVSKKYSNNYCENYKEKNNNLIEIAKAYLSIKDIDKSSEILDEIESHLSKDDIELNIKCEVMRQTIDNINGNYDNIHGLIECLGYAEENDKINEAFELSMRIGKHYIDREDEEKAKTYLENGIKYYNIIKEHD